MVSLDAFKGIAVASTFVVAMLGGLAPLLAVCWQPRAPGKAAEAPLLASGGGVGAAAGAKTLVSRALSVMNAASAGVFIAAGLMHLLADAIANEELSERSEELWGEEGESLIAISLCTGGFTLLLVVEQAVTACALRSRENSHSAAQPAGKEPPRGRRNSEDIQTDEMGPQASSLTVAVVVAVGLSLHSVMEGLALGAQQDESATAVRLDAPPCMIHTVYI
jgi:zinc transporter ZupT